MTTPVSSSPLLGHAVLWRVRGNRPGVVVEVLDGCNPLFRVAFDDRGDTVLLPAQDLTFLPANNALTA